MKSVIETIGVFVLIALGALVLAVLYAIWDDTLSPRHKAHAALMARMDAEEARYPITPITPAGGPLPHGGVCRSCGAGIAWRGGSYRSAGGEMVAHAPTRCTCGGEIEVLA